jgi:hypothetical protein
MRRVGIGEIVRAERRIECFPCADPTNHSYREFVAYFQARLTLSPHDITIGAHMAYGWMPRALNRFEVENLRKIAPIINRAKLGTRPSPEEMELLCRSIDNSLVGSSKLLSFVNPERLAIWDSRVIHFIQQRRARDWERRSIDNYFEYLHNLDDLIAEPAFRQIHESMNRKIGYEVTPLRACEYVMYIAGGGDS